MHEAILTGDALGSLHRLRWKGGGLCLRSGEARVATRAEELGCSYDSRNSSSRFTLFSVPPRESFHSLVYLRILFFVFLSFPICQVYVTICDSSNLLSTFGVVGRQMSVQLK